MYLANITRPDITCVVNQLTRFSLDSTKRHLDEIKHTFRYLRETMDLMQLFSNSSKLRLVEIQMDYKPSYKSIFNIKTNR